ncbi:MAG: hypothetical protein SFU83_23450 [Meiothermus sp.]|nr:hypothetical protein [Meiothermus sp.]
MPQVRHHKVVSALPGTLAPDSIYYVRVGTRTKVYVTNGLGQIVAYPAEGQQSKWLQLVPDSGNTYWIGSDTSPTALEPDSILVAEGGVLLALDYAAAAPGADEYTLNAAQTKITFGSALLDAARTKVKGVKF